MKIFISYKRENQSFAEVLHDSITSWNYDAWLDVLDIDAGEEWDTAIFKGLKASQIVVGILTPESLASPNVLDEWGYALSTGKRLLLLWLEDVDEADIPPRYIRIQRIDVRNNHEAGFERLRSALTSSAKVVPAPYFDESEPDKRSQPKPTRKKRTQERILQNKTNRSRMLDKVKAFWVDGVLEQSIHGAALIELGKERNHESVNNPWNTVLQHSVYGDYTLPDETRIYEIYHELHQEMLILGEPGSGKTTTLLELARDTIADSQSDETRPIPVVFNLSSWADERKSLEDWLVDELNTKYQVPRKVATAWVENDMLLLLLDGLDEVNLRYRDLCVIAINKFRSEHGFTSMVICSRITDYEALSNQLNLNGAIVIQPLNEQQIDNYLDSLGESLQGVRDAMQQDPELHKIAETPLMLSIMTLAFYGMSVEELPPLDSAEAQRKRLFETYTERMFARREDQWYTPPQAVHYLKWLAGRMVERKQSVFYIENLQVDWIAGDLPQRLFRIVGRTAFGLSMGLVVGLFSCIAFFILYLMFTENGIETIKASDALVISLSFLAVPAGLGGLIFGSAGILAFALDTIPTSIRPLKPLLRQMRQVYLASSLFSSLAIILTLLYIGLVAFIINPSFVESAHQYRSYGESLTGWGAIAYQVIAITVIYAAVGLVGASAASLLALVINTVSNRKRLLALLLPINILSLATVGLISTVILLTLYAVNGLLGFRTTELNTDAIFRLGIATIITLTTIMILTRFILHFLPAQKKVMPYFLFGVGSIVALLGISNNYHVRGFLDAVQFFIFIAIGGLVGYMVGRISDDISSAESLSWSWNWRWSGVGLLAMVGMGLIIGTGVVSDWSAYSHPREMQEFEHVINPREIAVAILQPTTTYFESQLESEMSSVESQEEVNKILSDKLYAERGHARLEQEQLDAYVEKHECASESIPLAGYYDQIPYGYFNSSVPIEEHQAELDNQLLALGISKEKIETLMNIGRELTFCQYNVTNFIWSAQYYRQHYTWDGIQPRIDSLIRLTIALGISLIVMGGVAGGLRKTEVIDIRTQPNSGIRRTLVTALKVTSAFGVVGAIVGIVTGLLLGGMPEGEYAVSEYLGYRIIPLSMVLGLTFGLSLGFIMSGIDAVIKHYILRLFLMRSKSIPRNYASLLDYLAERILLRKVGGGYIFVHRYLLEYFADLEQSSSGKLHD